MIGSNSNFASTSSSVRIRAWHLLSVLWMAGMLCVPGTVDAQRPNDPFGQRRGAENPDDEEEPKKKPGLAERNNITPNPLMTLAEEAKFEGRVQDYTSSLRNQNPRPSDDTNIQDGMRYRVYRMTLAENWENIGSLRNALIKDIDVFAKDSPRAREIALTYSTSFLSDLLSDQPKIVKLNAVLALGQLNQKPADRFAKTPSEPYTLAAEPLVGVVESSNQTLETKTAAVFGLERILLGSDPKRTTRDRIAHVLAAELDVDKDKRLKPEQTWYLLRVAQTLGALQEPRTALNEPVAVDALWQTLLNDSLSMHLRARAGRSLSQLDLDRSFDVGLIAHEVVRLGGMITVQFNQNPRNPDGPRSFLDVYFTFQPQTAAEKDDLGWGLLTQANTPALRAHQALVEGAYEQSLKLVNTALGKNPPQPVPNAVLKEVADWLGQNPPASQKLYAESKSVEEIKASQTPEADANTAISRSSEDPPIGQ